MYRILIADDEGIMLESLKNIISSNYGNECEIHTAKTGRVVVEEAEKLNAQAEIERAKGAAEAIRIENGSITPTYIQYLWVRQQGNVPEKVIYIPTEANLPILEAKK